MSSGFASFKFSVEKPDLARIEETRRLLSVWRCGDRLYADVQHFAAIYDSVHRPWQTGRRQDAARLA